MNVLQRPTLILNRNWQPVNVTSVARAIVMVFSGTARVVEPSDYQTYDWTQWSKLRPRDGEPGVRAVRFFLRVPEVVTLNRYDRLPPPKVAFSRRNLFKRDRHTCQYCGRRFPSEDLTIDHVVPRSLGGLTVWENCVLACIRCNGKKGGQTPSQAGMKLLHRPIRPSWSPFYAGPNFARLESWSNFVSEAYWTVELQD